MFMQFSIIFITAILFQDNWDIEQVIQLLQKSH